MFITRITAGQITFRKESKRSSFPVQASWLMTSITIHVQIMKQKEGCFYLPFFLTFWTLCLFEMKRNDTLSRLKSSYSVKDFRKTAPWVTYHSILFTCYLFIFLITSFQIDLLMTKRSFHGIHGNVTHITWRNTRRLKTSSKSLACLPIMIKQR